MSTATEPTTPQQPSTPDTSGALYDPTQRPAKGAMPAPEPPAGEPTDPPAEYEWDGLKTAFGGKYRTLADVEKSTKEAQAKMMKAEQARAAMESRLGMLTGPPLDPEGKPRAYDFKVPEGTSGEINPEDPLLQAFTAWGHKWGVPEAAAQELFEGGYVPLIAGETAGAKQAEIAFLADHYGSAEMAVAKVQESFGWAQEILGDDALPLLAAASSVGAVTVLLDRLRAAVTDVRLPSPGATSGSADTEADILAMMKADPNWEADPAKVARRTAWAEAEAARRRQAGTLK